MLVFIDSFVCWAVSDRILVTSVVSRIFQFDFQVRVRVRASIQVKLTLLWFDVTLQRSSKYCWRQRIVGWCARYPDWLRRLFFVTPLILLLGCSHGGFGCLGQECFSFLLEGRAQSTRIASCFPLFENNAFQWHRSLSARSLRCGSAVGL